MLETIATIAFWTFAFFYVVCEVAKVCGYGKSKNGCVINKNYHIPDSERGSEMARELAEAIAKNENVICKYKYNFIFPDSNNGVEMAKYLRPLLEKPEVEKE